MPEDVVLSELLAATQAAVNHSRELLSIVRRLVVNVEGGPALPAETRADYWRRFARWMSPAPAFRTFSTAGRSREPDHRRSCDRARQSSCGFSIHASAMLLEDVVVLALLRRNFICVRKPSRRSSHSIRCKRGLGLPAEARSRAGPGPPSRCCGTTRWSSHHFGATAFAGEDGSLACRAEARGGQRQLAERERRLAVRQGFEPWVQVLARTTV